MIVIAPPNTTVLDQNKIRYYISDFYFPATKEPIYRCDLKIGQIIMLNRAILRPV